MKNDLPEVANTMHPVELTRLETMSSSQPVSSQLRLAALAGVKAKVRVVAGHATTTVGEILNLREGAVLQLDTELNQPFDIVVNDTVIARGELVAVGDHFGVCVSQVQPAAKK